MKLGFKFFLVFVAYFGANYCQRVTLIGSYFVSPNADYKAIVLASKANQGKADVSLLGSGNPETRKLNNLNGNTINKVNILAPHEGPNGIELQMKANNCQQGKIKLINTSDRSIIFINYDKPVYKTGDVLKFRIFVLDQNLKPHRNYENVHVSVLDSEGYVIQNFNNIETSKFGVYENLVKIADAPNLGSWKIQVVSGDRKASKIFNVQKPHENGLEVLVDSPSVVAHVDKRMYITIHVKDKIDEFFSGTARVSVRAKFKESQNFVINQHVKNVDILGSQKRFSIGFQDELGINFPTADMNLEFDVVVTDPATQRSVKITRKVELKYKDKRTIQLARKKYFKPTFKYPVRIRVKLLDGRPDNSFDQLSMTVKYVAQNSKVEEQNSQINLKNGETVQNLKPKADTVKIQINLKFAEADHKEEINRFPGINEYMQVSATNKVSNVGSKAQFAVKSTEEMETLHILVVGTQGIVHSQKFSDSIGKDVFNFDLTLTEEMKPEARGLAFYVRDDSIIYDEFSIKAGFSVENSLDIKSPDSAKPNDIINYDIKTERGSKVFISAVDQNPTLLNRVNEITNTDIYDELVYYLNLKFPNSSNYHFERFNGLVLEPIVNGGCNMRDVSSGMHESKEETNSNSENWPTNYFPDVWIDENYATSSGSERKSLKVSESLVTWRFFGISVHSTKGFTTAQVPPRTAVKKDIYMQMKAPTSAYDTEAFEVQIRVFNSLDRSLQSSRINVQIENGFIVREIPKNELNIKCSKFTATTQSTTQFSVNLLAGKITDPKEVMVQSNGNGDMKIKVIVNADNDKDEITKIVQILKSKKLISDANRSRLIDLTGSKRMEIDDLDLLQGESKYVTIYGNLLGPALEGLETIFNHPMATDEDKMMKLAASIINFKYMKFINKSNEKEAQKAYDDIVAGYQEAIVIIDTVLKKNDPNLNWLASMAVQNLIDMQEFLDIDQNLITKTLQFISKHQNSIDGSFSYEANSDYHRDIGTKFRKEIQTALIIAPFLKFNQIASNPSNLFGNQIQKTLNYLKPKGDWKDYVKAVSAYTFAINSDINSARELLQRMSNSFYLHSPNCGFCLFQSTYVEIASYTILAEILIGFETDKLDRQIEWLLSQRNAEGGFFSPYSTVLALQALYEYTVFKGSRTQNLQLFIDGRKSGKTITNPMDSATIELTNHARLLKVTGQGLGYAYSAVRRIDDTTDKQKNFIINLKTEKSANNEWKIHVKIELNGAILKISNLVVLEVELPKGYTNIHDEDQKSSNVEKVVVQNGRIFFYISKIELNQEYTKTIRTLKVLRFENHKPSIIRVYDYYRPNIRDTIHYSLDTNKKRCEKIEIDVEKQKLDQEKDIVEILETNVTEAQSQLEDYQTKLQIAQKTAINEFKNAQTAQANAEEAERLTKGVYNIAAAAHESISNAMIEAKTPDANDGLEEEKVLGVVDDNEQHPTKVDQQSQNIPQTIEEARREAADAHTKYMEAQNEVKEAEARRNNLDIEYTKAEKRVTDAEKEVGASQDEIRSANENAEETLKEAQGEQSRAEGFKNEAKKTETDAVNLKNIAISTQYNLNETQQNITKILINTANTISMIKGTSGKIQSLLNEIENLHADAHTFGSAANLRNEIIIIQGKVTAVQTESEGLTNKINTAQYLYNRVYNRFSMAINKVTEVFNDSTNVLRTARNMKQNVESAQTRFNSMKKKIEESQKKVGNAKLRLTYAENELKKARKDVANVMINLENAGKAFNSAKEKEDYARKAYIAANKLIEKFQNEANDQINQSKTQDITLTTITPHS